jgi:hypothetical protein
MRDLQCYMKIYAGSINVCWQTWKRRCKSTSNLAQVGQAASEDSSSRYRRDLTNSVSEQDLHLRVLN